jgi:hypothetical protein
MIAFCYDFGASLQHTCRCGYESTRGWHFQRHKATCKTKYKAGCDSSSSSDSDSSSSEAEKTPQAGPKGKERASAARKQHSAEEKKQTPRANANAHLLSSQKHLCTSHIQI